MPDEALPYLTLQHRVGVLAHDRKHFRALDRRLPRCQPACSDPRRRMRRGTSQCSVSQRTVVRHGCNGGAVMQQCGPICNTRLRAVANVAADGWSMNRFVSNLSDRCSCACCNVLQPAGPSVYPQPLWHTGTGRPSAAQRCGPQSCAHSSNAVVSRFTGSIAGCAGTGGAFESRGGADCSACGEPIVMKTDAIAAESSSPYDCSLACAQRARVNAHRMQNLHCCCCISALLHLAVLLLHLAVLWLHLARGAVPIALLRADTV